MPKQKAKAVLTENKMVLRRMTQSIDVVEQLRELQLFMNENNADDIIVSTYCGSAVTQDSSIGIVKYAPKIDFKPCNFMLSCTFMFTHLVLVFSHAQPSAARLIKSL